MLHTMVGSGFCSVLPRWQGVLGAIQRPDAKYDLVVKGGRVVDPSQSLSAARDVGIIGNKIARVTESIPKSEARRVQAENVAPFRHRAWAVPQAPTALPDLQTVAHCP